MRFVHLAPESRAKGIRRAGLGGGKAMLVTSAGETVALRNAVFAMPVVADFWTTFQWLRELRRWTDERMVAVYFRVPDEEVVHVGRYGQPHLEMTATAAAAWVMKNPAGAEVVLACRVESKDVLGVREVRQLVGWIENPDAKNKSNCVCPACLPQGDRHFMRRVRGAFAAGMSAVREARTNDELLTALGRLEFPLERARGRIEPKGLMALACSDDPGIRRAVAALLGLFRPSQVQHALERLLRDDDAAVRCESVAALVRSAGVPRTADLLARADAERDVVEEILLLVEMLEFQPVDRARVAVLERFAGHPDEDVRESVADVARAWLEELDDRNPEKVRLESLARARDPRE